MSHSLESLSQGPIGEVYSIQARLEEVGPLRHAFASYLRDHEVTEDAVSNWCLVLSEAVVNAIKHGCQNDNRHILRISWEAIRDNVILTVEDPGKGPDEEVIKDPKLPKDPFSQSGRGLFLIYNNVNEWEHWRSEKGYRLVLRKKHEGLCASSFQQQILDDTLEELSNAYENLSAFYRLGDGLARAENLPFFIRQAIKDLQRAVQNDFLALNFSESIFQILGRELLSESYMQEVTALSGKAALVYRNGSEFVWDKLEEVKGEKRLKDYACGACFPVQAGGRVRGVISVARKESMPFRSGELNTIRTFADIVGIAVLNARNTIARSHEARALRELEIAANIQKTLLPLPVVPKNPYWELTTRREGAREVAGDYVGAVLGRNGELNLVMVDVMGKGVSASFLAGMFRTAFHISLTFQYSPVGLMLALNRTLQEQVGGDLTLFATCALARIGPALDQIEVVNAGHCPVVLMHKNGESQQVPASGPPLGLFKDADYSSELLQCTEGDKLYLVTDGLFEWSQKGQPWGWKSFLDYLTEKRELTGQRLWENLGELIQSHADEPIISDDRTFLCWDFQRGRK